MNANGWGAIMASRHTVCSGQRTVVMHTCPLLKPTHANMSERANRSALAKGFWRQLVLVLHLSELFCALPNLLELDRPLARRILYQLLAQQFVSAILLSVLQGHGANTAYMYICEGANGHTEHVFKRRLPCQNFCEYASLSTAIS